MKRKALGRGLDALLPKTPAKSRESAGLVQIEIDLVRRNPFQPRTEFDDRRLEELTQSIRVNGILQPVIVRRRGEEYELVAGERRWRAAQRAGLATIPALVQELSDEKALELALVENIQRDDLNPIEEAHAFQMLADEHSLTQQEIAARVGRSRAAVTNTLRLLRLPSEVQRFIVEGELSMGHARALLSLPLKEQRRLAQEILRRQWSVRQTERKVQQILSGGGRPKAPRRVDPNVRAAAERLEELCKTRVEIRRRGRSGQIVFYFSGDEELDRLFELFKSQALHLD